MNVAFYLKLSTLFFIRQNLHSMPSTQYSFFANRLLDGQVKKTVLGLFDSFEIEGKGVFLKKHTKGFQVGLHGSTQRFVLLFKPLYKKFSRSKLIGCFYKKPVGLSEKFKILAPGQREESLRGALSTIFQAMQVVQAWLNEPKHKISDASKSVEPQRKKAEIIVAREEFILGNKKIICEKLNIITEHIIANMQASIKKLQERLEVKNACVEKNIEFIEQLEHELHRIMNQSLNHYANDPESHEPFFVRKSCQEVVQKKNTQDRRHGPGVEKKLEFVEAVEHDVHRVMNQSMQYCENDPEEQEPLLIIKAYQEFVQKAKYFCFLPSKKNERTCVFLNPRNKLLSDVFFKSIYFKEKGFDYFTKEIRTKNDNFIQLYTIETMLELIIELKTRVFYCPLAIVSEFMDNLCDFIQWAIQSFKHDKSSFEEKKVRSSAIQICREFDKSIEIILLAGNHQSTKISHFFCNQDGYVFTKTNELLKKLFCSYNLMRSYKARLPEGHALIEKVQEGYQLANDILVGFIQGSSNIRKFLLFYITFMDTLRQELYNLQRNRRREIIELCSLLQTADPSSLDTFLSARERQLLRNNTQFNDDIYCSLFGCFGGYFVPSEWLTWGGELSSVRNESNKTDKIYDLLAFPKLKPYLFQRFFSKYTTLEYDSPFKISDLYPE